jgi:hypothetical protein
VIDVLLAIAITGVIFLVVGAPFAFSVRRPEAGWITLATDSAGFGIIVVPLAIVLWSLYSWLGLAIALLVVAVFMVFAVRGRVGLPRLSATRPPIALIVVWILVVVAAVVLRLHDSTFLPWVGDMGAYVNWSNEFVRTGELGASWPPIYSAFLSLSTAIFGSAGTTSGIAITGLVLLAVVARVLYQLAVNRWVIVGIVGALAFNVHAIWYSTFPSSESLNAPAFVIWASMLIVVMRAPKSQLPAALGLAFLVMLHLCLLRGSGSFLLAPALLLAIASIALPAWRARGVRIWMFFLATLVAAEVGVLYGVTYIPRYFVDMQLRMLAPSSLFEWGKQIGLFAPGVLLFAVLIVMTGVAALGLRFALRHPTSDPEKGARATRVLAIIAAVVLFGGLALEAIVGANIWLIFVRTGLWVAAVPLLTLAVIGRRKRVLDDVPVVFLLVATSLMLIAFHTPRLGNDRIHAFFIYWDRYLYSEVIPALAVVAGVGLTAAVGWVAARWPAPERLARVIPVSATILALAAVTVPHAPAIARISEDSYMAGAYPFTLRLASAVDPAAETLWGATSPDAAPGFFFPNTWMAFAVPLERTFGFDFPNVDQGTDNFAPDDVVTTSDLEAALDDSAEVFVYETQTGKGRPLDERISSDLVAIPMLDETSDISLLAQERTLAEWTHAEIRVIIWRVSRA